MVTLLAMNINVFKGSRKGILLFLDSDGGCSLLLFSSINRNSFIYRHVPDRSVNEVAEVSDDNKLRNVLPDIQGSFRAQPETVSKWYYYLSDVYHPLSSCHIYHLSSIISLVILEFLVLYSTITSS